MRRFVLLAFLALAACGQKADGSSSDPTVKADLGKPGISAAAGIALTYEYGFRLPADRIAAAQEEDAALCEARGPNICRIAGLTYDVGRDRNVRASLELRLAPEAARAFGKEAISAVLKHGGMLAATHITSEEAGAAAAAAQGEQASLGNERSRIENQLKQAGLSSAERTQLQSRVTQIAEALRTAQTSAQTATQKLTSTPMTLTYETGVVDQSLSEGPLIGALKDGGMNIVAGTAVIITILVSLVPWAVLAVLAVALWKGVDWYVSRQGWGVTKGKRRTPPAPNE